MLCGACTTHIGYEGEIRAGNDTYCSFSLMKDIVYTPESWPEALVADIYQPHADNERPAVLMVHGGGWEGRTREDMDDIAREFAQNGFVVANISYRFAPEYQFPAQLHDLQQAVRWLRSNAGRFNVDAERIGAYGFSSGGHLVALLAMVSPGDELDTPYGGSETRLRAVVAGAAPTDLRKYTGSRLVPRFLGATPEENPDVFALASPVVHVSADDPPVFLYHGSLDRLVDISHARDMRAALESAGVYSELFIVNGLGHASLFVLNHSAVRAAMNFLRRHLGMD